MTAAPTDILFYVFSAIGLAFAALVVAGKNPISSAFALVVVFFCVAADFVLLEAHLIAALQILVYAGAIMVLFVFVIMLLNADTHSLDPGRGRAWKAGAFALCAALAAMFAWCVMHAGEIKPAGELSPAKVASLGGNTRVVSAIMFSDYVLPFELTSILLLVGIVGSVALAKRRLEKDR